MIGWLSRIGGCLWAPRRTFALLLHGEQGGVGDLAVYLLVAMIGSSPDQILRPFVNGQGGLVGGLLRLVSLWVSYSVGPLLVCAGLGLALAFAHRFVHKRELLFEALIPASTYLFVPVGLLALLGAMLRALGWNAWVLPHVPWSGFLAIHPAGWEIALKAIGSYGWSAVLFMALHRSIGASGASTEAAGPARTRFSGALTLGVLLVTSGISWTGAIAHLDEIRPLGPGDRAAGFTLPRADGVGRIALADFSAKPVIVELWATWCPSCVQFLPSLHDWALAHPGAIVLSVHQGGTPEEVRVFVDELLGKAKDPAAPGLFLLVDVDERLSAAYRVDSVPVFFALAPGGLIRAVHWGVPSLTWLTRFSR
jgi:thiol-disulfide isomerase/thioredoxin